MYFSSSYIRKIFIKNTIMSHPDYNQRVDHHQCILIVVKPIGTQIDKKKFNKIYKKISQIQHVTVQDQLAEEPREIWLRYKKNYTAESNNWGDFQSHRKVLGLITIGKCSCQKDLETLWKCHNTLQEKYSSTLFNSKCLLFGMNPSDIRLISPISCRYFLQTKNIASSQEKTKYSEDSCDISINKRPTVSRLFDSHINNIFMSNSNPNTLSKSFHELQMTGQSSVFDKVSQPNHQKIRDKREVWINRDDMDRSVTDDERDILDSEVEESQSDIKPNFTLYEDFDKCSPLESDIYSFISSIFSLLETKRLDYLLDSHPFHLPHLTIPVEKDNIHKPGTENRKLWLGRMKKHIADLTLQAGLPHEAFSMYTFAIELLKSAGDWLWLASTYEGQCASSMVCLYPTQYHGFIGQKNSSFPSRYTTLSVPKGNTSHMKSGSLPRNTQLPTVAVGRGIFSPEKITDKFREAIVHYSKFRNAAVIEVECCIKAAKAHILQEKYLIASEFLQNILYLNFTSTPVEQIQWWSTLSDLYTGMNFHRKAAFYKHSAAVYCVSSQMLTSDWNQCCELLLQTFRGYKIFFESNVQTQNKKRWTSLQIKILQETIGAATKIGNNILAIRLLTFMLTTFVDDMTDTEKLEAYSHLGNLTAVTPETSTVCLVINNNIVIPRFHFLNLPYVRSFCLQKPASHFCPLKISSKSKSYQESSFICSPIQVRHKKIQNDCNKVDFKWVCQDICEVMLEVFNPLPFELQVTHMELIVDSVDFECFQTQLTLAPNSGPHPVTLLGRPLICGEHRIYGYNTEIQNIKSCCHLIDLPSVKKSFLSVDVIPSLPHLEITTTFPISSTYSIHKEIGPVIVSAITNLYCGESQECIITLFNNGREKVEMIDIEILKGSKAVILTWNKKELSAQIPISPGDSADLKLNIHTVGSYFGPKENIFTSGTICPSYVGNTDFMCNGFHRDKFPCFPTTSPGYGELMNPMIVETYLQFRYSGGAGMLDMYCRQCVVVIVVELLPSLLITNWDVMASEQPTICYLSLDVFNATNHEMELEYGDKKWIQIDVHNTCRIVLPIQQYSVTSLRNECSRSDAAVYTLKRKIIKLEDACQQHLYDFINLKWSLPGINISGITSFNKIGNWTPLKVNALIASPLQWRISINDEIPGIDDFSFVAGELVLVTINLQNISDFSLCSLCLSIRAYQDYQNGYLNYQLDAKLAIIGSDQILINKRLELKIADKMADHTHFWNL